MQTKKLPPREYMEGEKRTASLTLNNGSKLALCTKLITRGPEKDQFTFSGQVPIGLSTQWLVILFDYAKNTARIEKKSGRERITDVPSQKEIDDILNSTAAQKIIFVKKRGTRLAICNPTRQPVEEHPDRATFQGSLLKGTRAVHIRGELDFSTRSGWYDEIPSPHS